MVGDKNVGSIIKIFLFNTLHRHILNSFKKCDVSRDDLILFYLILFYFILFDFYLFYSPVNSMGEPSPAVSAMSPQDSAYSPSTASTSGRTYIEKKE